MENFKAFCFLRMAVLAVLQMTHLNQIIINVLLSSASSSSLSEDLPWSSLCPSAWCCVSCCTRGWGVGLLAPLSGSHLSAGPGRAQHQRARHRAGATAEAASCTLPAAPWSLLSFGSMPQRGTAQRQTSWNVFLMRIFEELCFLCHLSLYSICPRYLVFSFLVLIICVYRDIWNSSF